jgi:hypothetical protein
LGDQVETRATTAAEIMRDPAFAIGAADLRAGLPFRPQYERWAPNTQWNYERGRAWALLAPRHVRIRGRDGKINPAAIGWYERMCEAML